ncbi:chromatin assembly factor 1 subunit A-domain-containing protein [Aspergillus desertorum]
MDTMQVSVSEASPASQSASIPASALSSIPASNVQTVPSTQPQPIVSDQLSPGQKRYAQEADAPSTPIPLTQTAAIQEPDPTPIYINNKQNASEPLGWGNGHSTVNTTSMVVPAHAITGTDNPMIPITNTWQVQSQESAPPAAKKRKLLPAEREAKQQEKEARERQKLEEKARKDEERARREEEKRKRDAEKEEERKKREEKKRAKDEERAAREEERRKKDEERLKKERAQMKLNSFFAKPKVPTEQSSSTAGGSPKKPSGDGFPAGSSDKAREVSDYKREFPDFFLHPNTTLAPPHRFERDGEALAHLREKLDSFFRNRSAEQLTFRPSELFKLMPYKRRRGYQKMSVRDILLQMQNLSDLPETSDAARRLQESLKQVQMKSLKFGEDVRPPYQGTYTKQLSKEAATKLMRNPFSRVLPEVNYDYDSEAEWEDAEEGEELDSEEEEEGSEDGDEDMDGFLDDEDDHLANGKRRLLVGDLEPVCTGIKWQDQGSDPELEAYKIETILPSVTFPIDPFSSSYWYKPPKAPEPGLTSVNGLGQRPTWNNYTVNPVTRDSAYMAMQNGKRVPGNPKRAFPPDQLGEFKTVVEGSDLTKTGLIEVLKKRFPKVSKNTLKDTLDSVATRIGQKEADKKWVCK